jgi:hypothetical protein
MAQTDNKTQKLEFSTSPDFQSYYANSARITVNVWDFRLLLGEVEEATQELLRVSEKVKITMSPQHAKVFSRVLAENVKKYEETFGEIKVPAELIGGQTAP